MRTTKLILALVLMLGDAVSQAAGEQSSGDPTHRLVAGLRERRLYSLAEKACRDAMLASRPGSSAQVSHVVQQMRIMTEQALQSPEKQQAGHWNAANSVAEDFGKQYPQHPRLLLVKVQQALTGLAQANSILNQLNTRQADEDSRAAALEISQLARGQLKSIQAEVANRLLASRRNNPSNAALTTDELRNLQRNLNFQLAQCGFNRAGLYAADDTLNRTSALTEVEAQLTELQRLNRPGEPLWWQTQLALADCYRMSEQFDRARICLERMSADELKSSRVAWNSDLLLGQIELLQADGTAGPSFVQKSDLLLTAIDRSQPSTPELDVACVRLLVRRIREADRSVEANELLAQAKRRIVLIDQQHGEWWRRQAEQVVSTGVSAELFARNSVHSKTSNVTAGLIESVLKASQKAESLGQHEQAGSQQVELATQHKEHPQAPSIHLRGCWNLGQAAAGNETIRAKFTKQLLIHLKNWPVSPTRNTARLWLGKQQAAKQQWETAAETFLRIDSDSPQRSDAIFEASNAARQAIERTTSDRPSVARAWIKRFETASATADGAMRLAVAELSLIYDAQPVAAIEESLDGQLNEADQSQARALKVATSLLANGSSEQFNLAVSKLKILKNEKSHVKALRLLESIQHRVPDTRLADLNRAKLSSLDFLLDQPADARQHNRWMFHQAIALGKLDRNAEALTVLNALATNNPADAAVRMQQARATTAAAETDSDRRRALNLWRSLAKQLKPQTENWFEAKLKTAQLLLATGDKQLAGQLLDYVGALPSGWRDSAFADDFTQLQKQCR